MKNLLLLFFAITTILSCHKKKDSDYGTFKEVKLENLTTGNAPQGLEQRDGTWAPASGWELVVSKDGQHAILMQTGTDSSSAGFECKCNEGSGKCKVKSEIVMCIADECTDCSTVLKIYDRLITVNRTNW